MESKNKEKEDEMQKIAEIGKIIIRALANEFGKMEDLTKLEVIQVSSYVSLTLMEPSFHSISSFGLKGLDALKESYLEGINFIYNQVKEKVMENKLNK